MPRRSRRIRAATWTACSALLAVAAAATACGDGSGRPAWLPPEAGPEAASRSAPAPGPEDSPPAPPPPPAPPAVLDRVGGVALLALPVPAWERLTPRQRILAWHLARVAEAGRELEWARTDPGWAAAWPLLRGLQRHRDVLDSDFAARLDRFLKRVWVHGGRVDRLTGRRLRPEFGAAELRAAVQAVLEADVAPAALGLPGPEEGTGSLRALERALLQDQAPTAPDAAARAGRRVAELLDVAAGYADEAQSEALRLEAAALRSGDLLDQEAAERAWLADAVAPITAIPSSGRLSDGRPGPLGAYREIVHTVDDSAEAARIMAILSREAAYFESRAPWNDAFKRIDPRPATAALAHVVALGSAGPLLAEGASLPGDESLRRRHGSRSYVYGNVQAAIDGATAAGMEAFVPEDELEAFRRFGPTSALLMACLHQALGHVSGAGGAAAAGEDPLDGNQGALEQARADLVALHHIWDPRLVELGIPAGPDIALAAYRQYARKGLTQLRRLPPDTPLRGDDMRAIGLVVGFLIDSGVVKPVQEEGVHFYRVVSPVQMRHSVAALLRELMRIKATGDVDSLATLMARYVADVDQDLRSDVAARAEAAGLPAAFGLVPPLLQPVQDPSGALVDIRQVLDDEPWLHPLPLAGDGPGGAS